MHRMPAPCATIPLPKVSFLFRGVRDLTVPVKTAARGVERTPALWKGSSVFTPTLL